MFFDTHLHTQFSTDSRMTVGEAIARGRELRMGVTITEHMDMDYPKPQAFTFDVDEYFRAYERFRSDTVLLGIEVGMRTDLAEENRALVEQYPFDYVIGSIHVIDYIDIYQEEFYLGRTKAEVYGRYFDSMLACMESYDFIDSLGHIDYIARYARFADPELYYGEFAGQIDAVLAMMASKEKALEINTRRIGNPDAVAALLPICHRFRQLGGRLVTIGSDAHNPDDIGKHFAVAFDMADACGLKPVYYVSRQPRYIKR